MAEIRRYTPESGLRNPLILIKDIVVDLGKAAPLAWRFAVRNISSKYRQSFLGMFWALIPPLATSLIWIILNSQKIVQFDPVAIPYPVFVLVGTLIWQTFTESTGASLNALKANQSLIIKINFPREALLLTGVLEIAFNLIIKIGLLVIILLIFGVPFQASGLLGFLGLLIMMMMGYTFGLFLVPVAMLYKDVQMGLGYFLQFLMYLTPVIYPPKSFDGILSFLNHNPFTPILEFTRDSITAQTVNVETAVLYLLIILPLLFMGLLIFRLSLPIIIERLGS